MNSAKTKLVAVWLIFVFSVFYQRASAQNGFSIGITGGPQITRLNGLQGEEQTTLNWNAGLIAAYNFTKRLGLRIDIRYSKQGQRYSYEFSGVNATNTGFTHVSEEYYQKINYIKIPLLFTFKSNTEKKVAFIGSIGPQITYMTHAEKTIITSNYSNNNSDSFTDFNFGIAIGLGAAFRISNSFQLNTGLRLDHDLTAIGTNFNGDNIQNLTNGFDIGLIYFLK